MALNHSRCWNVARWNEYMSKWKKALRETQTLRAGFIQKFSPRRRPLPGAQDGQNLISWRWSLPLPTNPVWWGSMHAISSYRGNRPTNTQTNKDTHKQTNLQTGPITIHCDDKLSAQCNSSTVCFNSSSSSRQQQHSTPTTIRLRLPWNPIRLQFDHATTIRRLTLRPLAYPCVWAALLRPNNK